MDTYYSKLFAIQLMLLVYLNTMFAQCNLIENSNSENIDAKSRTFVQSFIDIDKETELDFACMVTDGWNYGGTQTAHYSKDSAKSGKIYQLLTYFWEWGNDVKVQNITASFSLPLVKDSIYNISFYIKPFSGNHLAKYVTVGFTDSTFPNLYFVEKKNKQEYLKSIPLPVAHWHILTNVSVYEQVEFKYKAKGGEQYIYIGNFKKGIPKDIRKTKQFGYWKNYLGVAQCTYMVDDLEVLPSNPEMPCKEVESVPHKEYNTDTLSIEAICFDHNSTSFNTNGKIIADSLITKLLTLSIEHISIVGYADTTGSSEYNLKLSQQRADGFAALLIKSGIPPNKINTLGFGEIEGELNLNRRVEIIVRHK